MNLAPGAEIAVIVKGYPRLSETFIAQELLALEQRGLRLCIASLRHPTDPTRHAIHREIHAPVTYLPEYLHQEPGRVIAGWRAARRLPGYHRARAVWRQDLARDRTPNRVRRFGQALVLAAELPTSVRHLHVHFLHTPASVAHYAALLTGLPWSASAHARDIWTTPDWELRDKLDAARWVVTCTAANRDYLQSLATDPARIELLYHGLDLRRFPGHDRPSSADGRDPQHPVSLLTVSRAVPKKGLADLLAALAMLPASIHWRLTHIGAGPLRGSLIDQAEHLGIGKRIDWRGAQSQDQVLQAYRAADLAVLASRIAPDGDRDGLPNVLLEAQSQGLACLSTRISGIPELIEHAVTGWLVTPAQPGQLAAALATLIGDPALRRRLGNAGRERVRNSFDFTSGIDQLTAKLTGDVCASPSTRR